MSAWKMYSGSVSRKKKKAEDMPNTSLTPIKYHSIFLQTLWMKECKQMLQMLYSSKS